jgi:hypothetical protein
MRMLAVACMLYLFACLTCLLFAPSLPTSWDASFCTPYIGCLIDLREHLTGRTGLTLGPTAIAWLDCTAY